MIKLILKLLTPFAAIIAYFLEKHQEDTGGLTPHYYFHRFSHIFPQAAIELLIFKTTNRGLEIFLTQREPDDPYWSLEWHFVGTVVRRNDSVKNMWKRLADELGIDEIQKKASFTNIDITSNKENFRGSAMHLMHYVFIDSETTFKTGKFFPVDNLPEKVILHHQRQIRQMVKFVQKNEN